MKRLVFIVEGETEEAFVNTILRPYFQQCGLYNPIQCFKIKHTQGGMRKYSYVRNDVLNTIYEHDVIVTTMFDLYALPSSFPGFAEAQTITNHLERVLFLEAKPLNSLALIYKATIIRLTMWLILVVNKPSIARKRRYQVVQENTSLAWDSCGMACQSRKTVCFILLM